jgi:hypothetical protein
MRANKEKDSAGRLNPSAESREAPPRGDIWGNEDPVPDDSGEAGTRWILRIIPLVHGAVVGHATGELLMGLSGGLARFRHRFYDWGIFLVFSPSGL